MNPLVPAILLASITFAVSAEDTWPTYRHDVRRSGTTTATLALPLSFHWTHRAGTPRQAWSGPAKWDAFAGNDGLQSMRNFDPCHYVTAGDGRLYFGSSADDAAHCLDAATGKPLWTFFTNAPVRLPPTVADGLAWFGSDDGHAYCVNSSNGRLRWNIRAAPSDRLIPNNGKLISPWPVRTGVLVAGGKAWFAASLVPWESSFLYCVDPATGGSAGDGFFVAEQREVTLQGAMLAGGDRIFIPQGRAAPLSFQLADGKPAGTIGHAGGVTCVLTENNQLLAGPQHQKAADDQIKLTDLASGKPVATFNHTNRVTVAGHIAYLHNGRHLVAIDLSAPEESRTIWQVVQPAPAELIVAGPHLILGLKDRVEILDAASGEALATLEVDGIAHGLVVAGGRLFVSTDRGTIHSFGS